MKGKFVILILACTLYACSHSDNKASAKTEVVADTVASVIPSTGDASKMPFYPFQINDDGGRFSVAAYLESDELYPKYYNLFKKHGYEGNGYCWEGHIKQILEKTDKELLTHMQYDPEAGGFYAYADSKESQLRFVKLLAPIFKDTVKLAVYVQKADRARIDD